MTKREYKLAGDPFTTPVSGQVRREILEITGGGHRSVILVVSNDDAMDVLEALRRAYQDGREDRGGEDAPIEAGTRVRLTDPPGVKFPYGVVGVAESSPNSSGLFWAEFPQGRMHTRVSEVEVVHA